MGGATFVQDFAPAPAWLDAKPWRHWLVVYGVVLSFFSLFRCAALSAMFKMFGTPDERTGENRFHALALGSAEDFLLVTILLVLLSLVDAVVGPTVETPRVWRRKGARLFLHTLLVLLAVLSFGADMLLIRSRELRFTFEFIETYVREFKFTAGFEVDPREVYIARETAAITAAVLVLQVSINMLWLDLSRWHLATPFKTLKVLYDATEPYAKLENGEQLDTEDSDDDETSRPVVAKRRTRVVASSTRSRRLRSVLIPLAVLTALSIALLQISQAAPAVVSATALNDSLNELYRIVFGLQFLKSLGDGTIESAEIYLHPTETYELFKDDVLYRRTKGFQGPLAFDVQVNQSDLPNVLVIAVESFRYQDSLYIVGNSSRAILQKQGNITLTPNFDRWAKRGVAFRNCWSSWQTSRSVEGILFGQVPYDHVSDSGTTTGRRKVKLNGMPQYFHARGYETAFTTGARLNYDGWDKFFRPHGFDEVVGAGDIREYAEQHYNISEKDWEPTSEGGQGRAMYWGVQDDVSFEYLGDLLLNKTAEQRSRVTTGANKTPFFINHYTISSHQGFDEFPSWFENETLPDFSALYEGYSAVYGDDRHKDRVRTYAKIRYFSDMQLGKFLDRMQREGILNDTIVVVTGDHGQSPEYSQARIYVDETTTMRVPGALIAEGRLADYTGLVLEDAAHHYDLLNTLADIVGVPEGGFLQSSVGRSLKRSAVFGERSVWSNNPMRQLAVVKGHERLSYDRVFSRIGLYDVENDPMLQRDLLATLAETSRGEWETLRERGRRLSRYFRVRWDHACISKVDC